MSVLPTIMFWVAVVLLVDGSVGLIFENSMQRLVPKLNIRVFAVIEIIAGATILLLRVATRSLA